MQISILFFLRLKITGVISFYFVISLAMVFLNKVAFKNPNALLVTWIQFIIAFILSFIAGMLRDRFCYRFFSLIIHHY